MSRSFSRAASAKGVGCSVALFLAVPSARRLFRASSTPGTRWREGQECRAAFECVLQSQSAGLRFVPPFLGAPAPHRSALKLYLFFFMVVAHVDSPCETKNAQTRGLMTNLEGLVSIVSRLRVERTNLVNQLRHVDAALSVLGKLGDGSSYSRPKSKISRRGRARIAAAQRARWAKVKRKKKAA